MRKSRLSISRQRLVELTVVVLGVLIALGLENLIQEARYRADARDLERALISDLTIAVELSLERQAIAPCLTARLRDIGDRVDAATEVIEAVDVVQSSAGRGLVRPLVYRTPSRTWITASFDRAISSEAFKRIPSERAASYTRLFAAIRIQGERNAEEYFMAGDLGYLFYPRSIMNEEIRVETLNKISTLDRYQHLITLVSRQIVENLLSLPEIGEDVRLAFGSDVRRRKEFEASIRSNYGDCADLTVFDRLNSPAAS
jgi:hypothetical protein